jgi:hypothetical protein
MDPAFSPDGSRIAYVSTKPNGYFNVYIRPIKNGRWAGEEIAVSKDNKYRTARLYFGEEDVHITPDWTPDGRELLVVSNRGVPLGSGNVWRVPAVAGGMNDAQSVLAEQTLCALARCVRCGRRFVSSSGGASTSSRLAVQPTVGGDIPADVLPATRSIRAGARRRVDLHRQPRQPAAARLARDPGATTADPHLRSPLEASMSVLSARIVDDRGRHHWSTNPPDGRRWQALHPTDAYARVSIAGDRIFHTTGEFRVDLPAGKTTLTVVRIQCGPQPPRSRLRRAITTVSVTASG